MSSDISPYVTEGPHPHTRWLRSPPLRQPQELRAFQEAFTQFVPGVCLEPLNGQPLAVHGTQTFVDEMVISYGETTPSRCVHSRAHAEEEGIFLKTFPLGNTRVCGHGKEWDMDRADALFGRPGQTDAVVSYEQAHNCNILLSRRLLAAMAIDIDAVLLRPLRRHPAARMLTHYAQLLRDEIALTSADVRRATVLHMHDLAALLAGAEGDVAHQARTRGVRAARLMAVKQDIAAHFTDPALTIAAVARRKGVTPRYVQNLLECEGLTFTALVLRHRLELAHRLLLDPGKRAQSVGAIAYQVGFGDLSYFNRCFRRHYGGTPSEVRAAGLS